MNENTYEWKDTLTKSKMIIGAVLTSAIFIFLWVVIARATAAKAPAFSLYEAVPAEIIAAQQNGTLNNETLDKFAITRNGYKFVPRVVFTDKPIGRYNAPKYLATELSTDRERMEIVAASKYADYVKETNSVFYVAERFITGGKEAYRNAAEAVLVDELIFWQPPKPAPEPAPVKKTSKKSKSKAKTSKNTKNKTKQSK